MLLNLHRHTPHISIHAPSRERLSDSHRAAEYRRISIHAPSRERRNQQRPLRGNINFNPRSLAGATILLLCIYHCVVFQSTLPRGSDVPGAPVYTLPIHFNPRSLAGATYRVRLYTHCRYISIHAPSRERLKHNIRRLSCKNFNPRSLAGATQISERYTSSHQFQSTLPRGSDWKCSIKIIGITISIHAPSRERRESTVIWDEDSAISIHAPSRERLRGQKLKMLKCGFQSTLPRGSDS